MGMIKIPKQSISFFKENYDEIFHSGNLAEGGWNTKISELFNEYSKSSFSIPFCSNGSGLLAILMLLKKHRGYRDIFIQSNTMYGVKTIAMTSGLNLIESVPCSLPSLMPSTEQVKAHISKIKYPSQTVFMITHIGGIINPDILEIKNLCEENGIALVEDCAHSLGSTLNGLHSGLFGIAGVYSLYATKAVAAGEGGIAVTNDKELAYQLSRFQIYDRFDQVEEVACNFRISELQALFSFAVCKESDHIIDNKTKIAKRYIEACVKRGVNFVDPFSNGQSGNHYKFSLIKCKKNSYDLSKITNRTSPVYDYTLGYDPNDVHKSHICVPIWYDLEEHIVSETVEQILKC
tara:strand:- start:5169 stop:6212 length:1044 start_codon:yes stop_codon:yes gene_type:complete